MNNNGQPGEDAEYDKVAQASLNGIYVKAQELDRGHNDEPAPAVLPPGALHAADAQSHASTHASDAEAHASTRAGDAQSHGSAQDGEGEARPPAQGSDAESHASAHGGDAEAHASTHASDSSSADAQTGACG